MIKWNKTEGYAFIVDKVLLFIIERHVNIMSIICFSDYREIIYKGDFLSNKKAKSFCENWLKEKL